MQRKKIEAHTAALQSILRDFKAAKEKGKETNNNEERAQSIKDLEEIIKRFDTYLRKDKDLLELITGKQIEVTADVQWNDVVRPTHFEEDLVEEIERLKAKKPSME